MQPIGQTIEIFQLFTEPTRLRLLAMLAEHELSVSEIVAVTDLAQSRISTHLGKLKEAGLLSDRRVGTSTFYRMSERVPDMPSRLWELLRRELSDQQLAADSERAGQVVAARDSDSRWPAQVAGEMERHYSPGRTWEATGRAFASMLSLGDVLDLGSGDGTIAELLAPRARSITCVDVSPRVTSAAARRLAAHRHVRCLCADMHALPLPDASFDQVLLFNALASAGDPALALREASRVLRPSGQLSIVTLDAHGNLEATAAYGHVQPGFAPSALREMLVKAGLRVVSCELSTRERRPPRFGVVSAFAEKPSAGKTAGGDPLSSTESIADG